ncbi:MAG TPA: GAF domain-containing protein [Gammaproteobacteria bacterium]|nr:GAF domain-containing protein [Gammaproteobacteria bacterium]
MFNALPQNPDKSLHYHELATQLRGLFTGESDWLANSAQFAAFLFHSLPRLNWAGFYLLKDHMLVVGPFQGHPACVRIALGKGACGVSAEKREAVIIEDVQSFPGYIACDDMTRSEIVLPMIKHNRLIGVLDLDSPVIGRFDETDRQGLEVLLDILLDMSAI